MQALSARLAERFGSSGLRRYAEPGLRSRGDEPPPGARRSRDGRSRRSCEAAHEAGARTRTRRQRHPASRAPETTSRVRDRARSRRGRNERAPAGRPCRCAGAPARKPVVAPARARARRRRHHPKTARGARALRATAREARDPLRRLHNATASGPLGVARRRGDPGADQRERPGPGRADGARADPDDAAERVARPRPPARGSSATRSARGRRSGGAEGPPSRRDREGPGEHAVASGAARRADPVRGGAAEPVHENDRRVPAPPSKQRSETPRNSATAPRTPGGRLAFAPVIRRLYPEARWCLWGSGALIPAENRQSSDSPLDASRQRAFLLLENGGSDMPNHLTPDELSKELGIDRQEVIRFASRRACRSTRARSTRRSSQRSSGNRGSTRAHEAD